MDKTPSRRSGRRRAQSRGRGITTRRGGIGSCGGRDNYLWTTTNATGAVLNGKSVPFNGSQTCYVSRGTYDYVLVATRGSEAVSASVTVRAG